MSQQGTLQVVDIMEAQWGREWHGSTAWKGFWSVMHHSQRKVKLCWMKAFYQVYDIRPLQTLAPFSWTRSFGCSGGSECDWPAASGTTPWCSTPCPDLSQLSRPDLGRVCTQTPKHPKRSSQHALLFYFCQGGCSSCLFVASQPCQCTCYRLEPSDGP